LKKIFVVISLILLMGCSNNQVVNRKGMIENTEIVMSSSQKIKPSWIVSTENVKNDYQGYLLMVGVSSQNGIDYSEKELRDNAYNDAKLKLSEYISVKIKGKTTLKTKVKSKDGEEIVTKDSSNSVESKTENDIKKAEPLDSYFEKIKIYSNNEWKTFYNYFVLYGMPIKEGAYKKKNNYKDLSNLKLNTSKSSLKKIKEMERMVEELNRNGIYLGAGMTSFETSDFETSDSDINLLQQNVKNDYMLDIDFGWEKYRTSYFLNVGMYSNSPLKVMKGGIGLGKKVVTIGPLDLKILGTANIAFAYGEIAKLYDEMTVGDNIFVEDSDLSVNGVTYGFSPMVKLEYNISSNLSLYGIGSYNFYKEMNDLNITITDRLDSNKKEDVTLNDFNPIINLSGIALKTGIQFNF